MMTAEQLKNSILQMAMQGKLVEQRPEDGTGEELYRDIQVEKKRLIKEKVYKKPKEQEALVESELPFDIPDNWMWCQVGDFFSNASGLSYKKGMLSEKSSDMVRILRGGNIGNEEYFFREDDQFIKKDYVDDSLYLKKGYMITPAVTSLNHIGKIGLIEKDYTDVVAGGFVLMLMPYFDNDVLSKYMLFWFDTKEHRDACRGITHKSGQAFYNLSREKLMNLPVPLPPLAEQKRIVAKIEELMPFVEQYAAASTKLNTLNATFPDQMKKSILQQAVMGKLVPQDPNDEPASVLLKKIAGEKKRLTKEGKIKKQKSLPEITEDEIPFDIPESWEWVRLSEICNVSDGTHQTPKYVENGIPFISAQNIKPYRFMPEVHRCVSYDDYLDYNKSVSPEKGDILMTRVGAGIGEAAIIDQDLEFSIYVSLTLIKSYCEELNMKYILNVLNSPLGEALSKRKTLGKGASQGNLNLIFIREFLLPLPPIEEQRRINDKVDLLLPLCINMA